MLRRFSSFRGSRAVVLLREGNDDVLEGRTGLKVELEGTRLCCPTFDLDSWAFTGEGGRIYFDVVLLNGGRFCGLGDLGGRPLIRVCV